MKKSLLLILILLSIFQSMYGEEIENKETKVTETKEESFTSKSTTESGIELKKETKIENKKKIAGLSPLLLITLLCQDSDDETSSVSVNGEDIPIIGSFYEGNTDGNREKIYGIGLNTTKGIEFIYQRRKYYRKDECAGFFTGSIVTAGINSMRTYVEKDSDGIETVYISNSGGKKVYSWGIRAGGNIGYRFKLGDSGTFISTRAGLVLPLHIISGSTGYNAKQKRELYATNAFFNMWDFGLHLECMF